jgi:hypothetical protein
MILRIQHFDKLAALALFILFVAITLPGISWGTPSIWHPDEQVKVADRALKGLTVIDTRNFNYPSLAKYTMYWLGRGVYGLGYSRAEFLQAARSVSVLLGGFIVILVYAIARSCGAAIPFSILAAFLVISSSQMALNARFAHVDIYLVFFSTLSVLLLLKYRASGKRLWLYGSFLGVGLSASSKYTGLSLILAVILVYLIAERSRIFKDLLRFFETLIIGLGLTFTGFVIGTPRMLLSMSFYVSNAAKALLHHATYGYDVGDSIGLFGQWSVLVSAWGVAGFIFFLAAIIWAVGNLVRSLVTRMPGDQHRLDPIAILLLCALALDLPMMVSYHYADRFFLSLLPLLSVLGGLMVQDIYYRVKQAGQRTLEWTILLAVLVVLIAAFLRVVSVDLLFLNDSRIAASRYVNTLPEGSSIEYTLYPPNIPDKVFKKFNYPIFFTDFADEEPTQGKSYQWNQGEPGIENRRPDYFIVDSFTYIRFDDPAVCESVPDECTFFKRLMAGETNYQLIQSFDYRLPSFLPQLQPSFLNPAILVFQRKSD